MRTEDSHIKSLVVENLEQPLEKETSNVGIQVSSEDKQTIMEIAREYLRNVSRETLGYQ